MQIDIPVLHAEECADKHIFEEVSEPETTALQALGSLLRLLPYLPQMTWLVLVVVILFLLLLFPFKFRRGHLVILLLC